MLCMLTRRSEKDQGKRRQLLPAMQDAVADDLLARVPWVRTFGDAQALGCLAMASLGVDSS
ncbi:uncharacterized protein BDZ83DRAFT_638641 [Colletotrichum acutatum]|uniref:Uncharacterized protein n=1 Tax=Glomerella acutata TaxID=27357 RepID=A0AAD8X9S1_GLOAC|nr:uncharacterized protein BDZ83DRAFT_638641 [Colletotrichum acutatum]KAK1712289.1 hypothetical protein BDZ83DRAFT_638641 [Colletotrichum acutatum]